MADIDNNDVKTSSWWKPTKSETIMLWLTIITVAVSVISQASTVVNNLLQFDSVYLQLYPLLNIFHLYIILYIITKIRDIQVLLPIKQSTSNTADNKHYNTFKDKLQQWICTHFGEIYTKKYEEDEAKFKNDVDAVTKSNDDDDIVDAIIKQTNINIAKTHRYFLSTFVCYVMLYIFELINSATTSVSEPALLILTIIINNIATLFWFFIYLTLNGYEPKNKIEYKETKESILKKYGIIYVIHRTAYCIKWFLLSEMLFKKPNKYFEFEKGNKKYPAIKVHKIKSIKFFGFVLFALTTFYFLYYIYYCSDNNIFDIEKNITSDGEPYYYIYRAFSFMCILLGGCAMLAVFSRLSSGFKKVPLSAFIVMLFYAAMQPLFYTGEELSASDLKLGQMLFIANLICLIGKFGLLYLIKWLFADYNLAYYFISEKIIREKSNDIKLHSLFSEEKTS
jgi:hypothetical protein